jgi:ureidoacrylate peracid hydrolase
VVDGGALVKGQWGSEFFDVLAPGDGDIVIEGKRGLDTFASTNLDFILRSRGIKTLAVGGFLTNCCVEGTMRSGYERGFDVVSLTDCVGATSMQEQENALLYTFPMFSTLMTAEKFAAELS